MSLVAVLKNDENYLLSLLVNLRAENVIRSSILTTLKRQIIDRERLMKEREIEVEEMKKRHVEELSDRVDSVIAEARAHRFSVKKTPQRDERKQNTMNKSSGMSSSKNRIHMEKSVGEIPILKMARAVQRRVASLRKLRRDVEQSLSFYDKYKSSSGASSFNNRLLRHENVPLWEGPAKSYCLCRAMEQCSVLTSMISSVYIDDDMSMEDIFEAWYVMNRVGQMTKWVERCIRGSHRSDSGVVERKSGVDSREMCDSEWETNVLKAVAPIFDRLRREGRCKDWCILYRTVYALVVHKGRKWGSFISSKEWNKKS